MLKRAINQFGLILVLLGSFALIGCGGDDGGDDNDQAPRAAIIDISGAWTGPDIDGIVDSVIINQQGDALLASTRFGTYTGNITGNQVILEGPGNDDDILRMTLQISNDGRWMTGLFTYVYDSSREGPGIVSERAVFMRTNVR